MVIKIASKKIIRQEQIDILNPDFATSVHYGDPVENDEKILEHIDRSNEFLLTFRRSGLVHSKRFFFITCANFDESIISSIKTDTKTKEQSEQAKRNLKAVEKYLADGIGWKVSLAFGYGGDSQCILYDRERFNKQKIEEKFREIFNQ